MKSFLRGLWGLVQVVVIIYVICITACLLCKNKYGFTQFGNMTLITIDENLATYLPETKKSDLLLVKQTFHDVDVGNQIYYYATVNDKYVVKTAPVTEIIHSEGDMAVYKIGDTKGSTIATNRVIGKYSNVYSNIGGVLDILESRVGFLLLVILPILLIFMYQVYALIILIKYGNEEIEEEEASSKKKNKKKESSKKEHDVELL